MVPLQMLGNAFSWLYDDVIVPFGNGVIDFLNKFIEGLNDWLGWLGVDIRELDRLKTTGELIEEFNEGLKKELTDSEKAFVETFEAMADKLNDLVDKQIQSLQDLYEVGALSGAEYETRSKELDAQKIRIDEVMLGVAIEEYRSIEDIRKWLIANADKFVNLTEKDVDLGDEYKSEDKYYDPFAGGPSGFTFPETAAPAGTPTSIEDVAKNLAVQKLEKLNKEHIGLDLLAERIRISALIGIGNYKEALNSLTALGYSSGIGSVPYDNFPAFLHKEETVVPGDFMSAVRSGELVLSGSKGGAGSTVNNYYVNVEGTVVTENELIEKVHKKTGTMLRRGYVS
jgi:hypothetical protein